MQSINPIETYWYGTRKFLIIEKEEIKYSSKIKQYKIWLTLICCKRNKKEHNPNWS